MLQRSKYNDLEPDAVNFFSECMTSPKHGRTPLVDEIYVSKLNLAYIMKGSKQCLEGGE
jgi:hypothetical protein